MDNGIISHEDTKRSGSAVHDRREPCTPSLEKLAPGSSFFRSLSKSKKGDLE